MDGMGWVGSPGGRGYRAPYGANNLIIDFFDDHRSQKVLKLTSSKRLVVMMKLSEENSFKTI